MTKQVSQSEFNPLYEETFDNTHELYGEMRRRCPVAHSEELGGFWALFKYDDIVRMVEDPENFTTTVQNVVPVATRLAGRRPPLHYDPPEHEAFRKPINTVFRKSRMRAIESTLRNIADDLLDPLVARGEFDFTKDFAEYFTAQSFGLILKLPIEIMRRAREAQVRYYRAQIAMDRPGVEKGSQELYEVARFVVEERKKDLKDPKEDLISALLLAPKDGEQMPEQLVVASIRQFLSAAQAAPQAVLGSIAVHLARDSKLQERLREHPLLHKRAIEEFLRLYAPYRVFCRTAINDVEIRGRKIKAGEAITMMFPSGNRDEEIFDRPHEFDLNRKPNPHIAFGRGPHQCPAAALARLELLVAMQALLNKTSSVELNGTVKMTDWLEFGPSSSPVRVQACR